MNVKEKFRNFKERVQSLQNPKLNTKSERTVRSVPVAEVPDREKAKSADSIRDAKLDSQTKNLKCVSDKENSGNRPISKKVSSLVSLVII
jgi:hypothetical protein